MPDDLRVASVPALTWQQRTLSRPDHSLTWYERGNGPTVICLSGGPGDDHSYLRPVVEPLASWFRWILYDQRGTGRSVLEQLDEVTLDVECLVADLEALRVYLDQDRLRIMGHSWGANLALLYSAAHSEHLERLALVGLGPLDDELGAVASANLVKALDPEERRRYLLLSEHIRKAVAADDRERTAELDAERLPLFARGAFYSPELAEQFVVDYLAAGAHRALNRRVNRFVSSSYRKTPVWERLDRITAAVLVLYGCQDFEPITQAYLLREHIPQVQICLLNRCGHMPWLEQPAAFYQVLSEFLGGIA